MPEGREGAGGRREGNNVLNVLPGVPAAAGGHADTVRHVLEHVSVRHHRCMLCYAYASMRRLVPACCDTCAQDGQATERAHPAALQHRSQPRPQPAPARARPAAPRLGPTCRLGIPAPRCSSSSGSGSRRQRQRHRPAGVHAGGGGGSASGQRRPAGAGSGCCGTGADQGGAMARLQPHRPEVRVRACVRLYACM